MAILRDIDDAKGAISPIFSLHSDICHFLPATLPSLPPVSSPTQDAQLFLFHPTRYLHWFSLMTCDMILNRESGGVVGGGVKGEVKERFLKESIVGIVGGVQGGGAGEEYMCASLLVKLFGEKKRREVLKKMGGEGEEEGEGLEKVQDCYVDLFGGNDVELMEKSKGRWGEETWKEKSFFLPFKRRFFFFFSLLLLFILHCIYKYIYRYRYIFLSPQSLSLSLSLFLSLSLRLLRVPFAHPWPYLPFLLLRHHQRSAVSMIEEEKKMIEELKREKERERVKAMREREKEGGEKREEEEEEEEEEIEFDPALKELAMKLLSPAHVDFLTLVLRFILAIESVNASISSPSSSSPSSFLGSSQQSKLLFIMSSFLLTNSGFHHPTIRTTLHSLLKILHPEPTTPFFYPPLPPPPPLSPASLPLWEIRRELEKYQYRFGERGEEGGKKGGRKEGSYGELNESVAHEGGVYVFVCNLVEQYLSVSMGNDAFSQCLLLFLQRGEGEVGGGEGGVREMLWIELERVCHLFLKVCCFVVFVFFMIIIFIFDFSIFFFLYSFYLFIYFNTNTNQK